MKEPKKYKEFLRSIFYLSVEQIEVCTKYHNMKNDLEFIQNILPDHYVCELREGENDTYNGVHCHSQTGIKDTFSSKEVKAGANDHWDIITKAIMQKFSERFMEIYHHTSTMNKIFTVFIKTNEINKPHQLTLSPSQGSNNK